MKRLLRKQSIVGKLGKFSFSLHKNNIYLVCQCYHLCCRQCYNWAAASSSLSLLSNINVQTCPFLFFFIVVVV